MSAATATPTPTAPTVTTPTTRRRLTNRLTNRLGSYGLTAAIGAGALAAFLPMCAPAAPATPQQTVVEITNQRRSESGLAPLTMNPTLTSAADAHAADQASVDTMSHTGTDGSDAGTRIARAGYPIRAWGENVAAGYSTPDTVMAAWMASPGHQANILNPNFTQIGIGLRHAPDGTLYWAMELGLPQ